MVRGGGAGTDPLILLIIRLNSWSPRHFSLLRFGNLNKKVFVCLLTAELLTTYLPTFGRACGGTSNEWVVVMGSLARST